MARIPWPSTAVNVSILCRRPVQREAYFCWSRGREREGRAERDIIGLRTSLEAQVFHIRHLATSHSLRTRQSVAARPHAPFAHGLSASRSGRRRTRVFHPPERRPIKSHVLQAQILSQILSAAPESSCHTHKHARIRLTVRPKSSREVSRAFCPRRHPGRARLIPLFNLPPPPSSEYFMLDHRQLL